MKKIFKLLVEFFKKADEDSLGAYAAQTTFFVLLSFFPFSMLIVMIASKLSLVHTSMFSYILNIAPEQLKSYITYIFDDIVYSNSYSFTVITVLVSLWSAAKGIQALSYGLDKIYCVEKKKNFFFVRFISALYTLVFIVLCIGIMVLHVFGAELAKRILDHSVGLSNATFFIYSIKGAVTFGIIFIFLIIIYYQLPGRRSLFRHEIIGAAVASFAWLLMTKAFSFYIKVMTTDSYMYGSLTSIILIIVWLYIGMQIILYGAEINYFISQYCENKEHRKKNKKSEE